MLCPQLQSKPRGSEETKLSGTKSTLLALRMVRKNNNCLSFLDRVCRYMKINYSGQFVVDKLSLEPSLPDFQAEPCLRHTSPCWRNPRPAKCSLLCPAAHCCTQPPCTGPCLSTRFPNGQPRKKNNQALQNNSWIIITSTADQYFLGVIVPKRWWRHWTRNRDKLRGFLKYVRC